MKLSQMNQEQLENYVDGGEHSDKDVIDLYEDLVNQKAITELSESELFVKTEQLELAKKKLSEKTEQLELAVKGLKWYASFWNHDVQLEDVGLTSMQCDRGEIARSTLSEIEMLSQ